MMKKNKLHAGIIICLGVLAAPLYAQQTTKLSDEEVASVAVIANQIDISYADIAKQKSKNDQILKFANSMIRDHRAVIGQASDLVKKLGVTPKDNAVSKKLLSDAEQTKKTLRAKSDQDFDRAYIDNEVAYHKAVINAVETLLIPESENTELKALLQSIVPALKTHLGHAEMVQKMYADK